MKWWLLLLALLLLGGAGPPINFPVPPTVNGEPITVSVASLGAKCDGTTDDTAAINNALNSGAGVVTIPARTCYSATGITIPNNTELRGLAFSAKVLVAMTAPAGSAIICAPNTPKCVATATAAHNVRISNLTVGTLNPATPTAGDCFYLYGQEITLSQVQAYNCYDGYYWYNGIVGMMLEAYSGKIPDSHIVMDTWAELHISNSIMGESDSIATTNYVKITGGIGSTAGPNTLLVTNSNFNNGGAPVAHLLNFVNKTGGNPMIWSLDNVHAENFNGTVFVSDSSWTNIQYLNISNSTIWAVNNPLFALDPASQINYWHIANSSLQGYGVTLAPTPAINSLIMTGNTVYSMSGPVSITSANPASLASLIGNTFPTSSISVAGPWTALQLQGGNALGLGDTATGAVNIDIPGFAKTYNFSSSQGSGVNYNWPTVTGTSTMLNMLQPNLAAGNSDRMYIGVDSSSQSVGFGYFLNATANQSAGCMFILGNPSQFCVRADGAIVNGGGMILKSYTVATLPACTATIAGAIAEVSDQSGTPTYGGTLTGGGTSKWPAFCNGSSWSAH